MRSVPIIPASASIAAVLSLFATCASAGVFGSGAVEPNEPLKAGVSHFVDPVLIGTAGSGTLSITGGSNFVSENAVSLRIGIFGSGTVQVSGGSDLVCFGGLDVGESSYGLLEMLSGAGGSCGRAFVGYDATGSWTMHGNSSFTVSQDLNVGTYGSGTVLVHDGSSLSVTGINVISHVGWYSGSYGLLEIANPGSYASFAYDLDVGYQSTGVTKVLSGGKLDSSAVRIGSGAGGNGTVRVSGSNSQWYAGGTVQVGYGAGSGTLEVLDGGLLDHSSSATFAVAFDTQSSGSVLVDGSDSRIAIRNSTLNVGQNATGSLTVSGGGVLDTSPYYLGFASIGSNSAGVGTVTVSGSNSQWQCASVAVGDSGKGTLEIKQGGTVKWVQASPQYSGSFNVGVTSTGDGQVTIAGTESKLDMPGSDVYAGLFGKGSIDVSNDAQLKCSYLTLGGFSGSQGTMTAAGSGSSVECFRLYVGNAGSGSLVLSDGADMLVTAGTSVQNYIGLSSSGQGAVTVDGVGTTLTLGTLIVGYTNSGGSGTLTLKNGGTVDAAEVRVLHKGSLNGAGTITGNVVLYGELCPGNSPGTLMIGGDLTMKNDSRLVLEIAGDQAGAYDQLNVTGKLTMAGVLEIAEPSGSAHFDAGDTWQLFIADNGFAGSFSQIQIPKTAEGDPIFQITGNGQLEALVTVPEPGTLMLVALGTLAILRRRARLPR